MTTRLRFLGAAGQEVVGPDRRFLIDPFLTGDPVARCGPDELEAADQADPEVAEFLELVEAERRGVRALAPAPGQIIVIDAPDARVEGTGAELPRTP